MNSKVTFIRAIDNEGDCLWDREFDSKKEAKAWVKDCGLDQSYWNQSAENETFALSIEKIELLQKEKGRWVCVEDWFPEFK